MNQKLKNILLNNLTVALILTAFTIWLVNPVKKKYLAQLEKVEVKLPRIQMYYSDLDNDGNSERIQFEENEMGNGCVKIYNPAHLGQFNSHSALDDQGARLLIADSNNDGFKEIYFSGRRNDSVFFNRFDFRLLDDVQEFFIKKLIPGNDAAHKVYNAIDLNNDNQKEILGSINAGFSLQPRKIYALDLITGEVKRTPQTGAKVFPDLVADIDGDGYPEIMDGTFSTKNYNDTSVVNSDWFTWFFVFDHQLNLKYDPVKITAQKASATIYTFKKNNRNYIFLYNDIKDTSAGNPQYWILDDRARLLHIDSLEIEESPFSNEDELSFVFNETNELAYVINYFGDVYRLNDHFRLEQYKSLPNTSHPGLLGTFELTGDNRNEYVFRLGSTNEFLFSDSEFSHFDRISLHGLSDSHLKPGVILKDGKPEYFYMDGGSGVFFISYRQNPLWNFRFLIWAAIFGGIYGLLLLIQYVQKERIKTQIETRHKIKELQFKVITSQLNPHFTFNALNTISSSVYDPQNPELYDRFTTFSRLIRNILSDSDRITRSLHDELNFTRDFLKIQKLRFKEAFDYSIEIGKLVDQNIQVPKLIIQIYVENAIKHGFPNHFGEDKLNIRILSNKKSVEIEIEDNGIGREKAKKNNQTQMNTGKGLLLMNDYIALLNKQNQHKIKIAISDVNNDGTGTLVKISIPTVFRYHIK